MSMENITSQANNGSLMEYPSSVKAANFADGHQLSTQTPIISDLC